MRLGQLARSLDVTPKEIVAYLSEKGIKANEHPNSKLSETDERDVLAHFCQDTPANPKYDTATDQEVSSVSSNIINPRPDPLPVIHVPKKEISISIEEFENSIKEKHTVTVSPEDIAEDEGVPPDETAVPKKNGIDGTEIIKMPKVELSGLKVVGKIELPKKEKAAQEKTSAKKEEPAPEVRYYKPERKKKPKKQRVPLTEEQKEARRAKQKKDRERKKQQIEKRKKERVEQQIKEKKKQHYQQKTKGLETSIKSKARASSKPRKQANPQPKTAWGKFWKWLNT